MERTCKTYGKVVSGGVSVFMFPTYPRRAVEGRRGRGFDAARVVDLKMHKDAVTSLVGFDGHYFEAFGASLCIAAC